MSYAAAAALQAAVHARLTGHPGLAGVGVHDAVPPGRGGSYIVLGPEEVRERGDAGAAGAEHRFAVVVVSDAAGFLTAKQIAGEVSEALLGAPLVLAVGRVAGIWFLRAVARRTGAEAGRRIELVFRARLDL
jgi:hypothetical protein